MGTNNPFVLAKVYYDEVLLKRVINPLSELPEIKLHLNLIAQQESIVESIDSVVADVEDDFKYVKQVSESLARFERPLNNTPLEVKLSKPYEKVIQIWDSNAKKFRYVENPKYDKNVSAPAPKSEVTTTEKDKKNKEKEEKERKEKERKERENTTTEQDFMGGIPRRVIPKKVLYEDEEDESLLVHIGTSGKTGKKTVDENILGDKEGIVADIIDFEEVHISDIESWHKLVDELGKLLIKYEGQLKEEENILKHMSEKLEKTLNKLKEKKGIVELEAWKKWAITQFEKQIVSLEEIISGLGDYSEMVDITALQEKYKKEIEVATDKWKRGIKAPSGKNWIQELGKLQVAHKKELAEKLKSQTGTPLKAYNLQEKIKEIKGVIKEYKAKKIDTVSLTAFIQEHTRPLTAEQKEKRKKEREAENKKREKEGRPLLPKIHEHTSPNDESSSRDKKIKFTDSKYLSTIKNKKLKEDLEEFFSNISAEDKLLFSSPNVLGGRKADGSDEPKVTTGQKFALDPKQKPTASYFLSHGGKPAPEGTEEQEEANLSKLKDIFSRYKGNNDRELIERIKTSIERRLSVIRRKAEEEAQRKGKRKGREHIALTTYTSLKKGLQSILDDANRVTELITRKKIVKLFKGGKRKFTMKDLDFWEIDEAVENLKKENKKRASSVLLNKTIQKLNGIKIDLEEILDSKVKDTTLREIVRRAIGRNIGGKSKNDGSKSGGSKIQSHLLRENRIRRDAEGKFIEPTEPDEPEPIEFEAPLRENYGSDREYKDALHKIKHAHRLKQERIKVTHNKKMKKYKTLKAKYDDAMEGEKEYNKLKQMVGSIKGKEGGKKFSDEWLKINHDVLKKYVGVIPADEKRKVLEIINKGHKLYAKINVKSKDKLTPYNELNPLQQRVRQYFLAKKLKSENETSSEDLAVSIEALIETNAEDTSEWINPLTAQKEKVSSREKATLIGFLGSGLEFKSPIEKNRLAFIAAFDDETASDVRLMKVWKKTIKRPKKKKILPIAGKSNLGEVLDYDGRTLGDSLEDEKTVADEKYVSDDEYGENPDGE